MMHFCIVVAHLCDHLFVPETAQNKPAAHKPTKIAIGIRTYDFCVMFRKKPEATPAVKAPIAIPTIPFIIDIVFSPYLFYK